MNHYVILFLFSFTITIIKADEIKPLECYVGITNDLRMIRKWNQTRICPSHTMTCKQIVIGNTYLLKCLGLY